MNFTNTLTRWYSINKREMPWRSTKEPYKIWLSEIILQQTQVKQGLPYYEVFVKSFPTVFDLANSSEETVLKLWQGLGYYSRARNLHFTAKHIADQHGGTFPNSYEQLLKLKGVGDYTASAIASICFNEPTAVVDGNVYRVLSRYFGIQTPINSLAGIKEFKTVAQKLIDNSNPGDHNQAIMEFGAEQCKPSNPDCSVCPLHKGCYAFKHDMIHQLPVKTKKAKVKKKYFNYVVLVSKNEETVLEKRQGKGIWQNLYQFPLIESDKSLTMDHLKKHGKIKDFVNSGNGKIKLFNEKEIIHKLSHQHLYAKFWIVETDAIAINAVPLNSIRKYPVPILINNFIEEFLGN